jgi:hypothetical protein
MIIYAASSLLVSHNTWFRTEQPPQWETLFEREYHHPVNDQQDLRTLAGDILKEVGMEGAFWAQRPKPGELRVDRFGFFGSTRLTYLIREGKLRAERQTVPWSQSLLRMHFRGGFNQPTFWNDLWAIIVDVVCIGILIWVVSGLLLWWRLAQTRIWGAVAVGAGVLSFLLLIWRL